MKKLLGLWAEQNKNYPLFQTTAKHAQHAHCDHSSDSGMYRSSMCYTQPN